MTIHRFSEREIARTSEAFGNIRHAFSTYEAVAIPRTATRPTASTAMGRLSLDYAFALTGFLAACSHATGASNAASTRATHRTMRPAPSSSRAAKESIA